MATKSSDYYVYVYIDPRNYEPFYYGKGRGARMHAHSDDGDSEKAARISEIRNAGLDPTIRVIACNLTEEQAFIIEATLIWKADGKTVNKVAGHFKENFRPLRSMHMNIPGFDFQRLIHFFNVGDGSCRTWEDNIKFNYVGAGQRKAFRKSIQGLNEGDIIAAYLSHDGQGFVGVGRITSKAKPAREFYVNGERLIDKPNMPIHIKKNLNDNDRCEWMASVEWIKTVPRKAAYFHKNAGLFVPRGVRASLAGHTETIMFIEQCFGVNLSELADSEVLSASL